VRRNLALKEARPAMGPNMKKKIRFSVQHQCASGDDARDHNVLPNKFVQAIGPFVFLQHICSCRYSSNESYNQHTGKQSHPHRGIATLTYILSGEVEHVDSIGNHVKLSSGGMHWMNAGKGIIRDEAVSSEFRLMDSDVSVVRFWINLPSDRKGERPEYFSFQSNEIPIQQLEGDAGWVKVLLGKHRDIVAEAPCYSKEFLYHIHLEAGKQFSVITEKSIDYAAFLPSNAAVINDIEFQAGKLVAFTSDGEIIELYNSSQTAVDIIQFGGQAYNEPIVTDGSFVMNTPHEITQAFNDFYDGKYGEIKDFKKQ
jgi:redox-sensitive bicupin YhaK (pirin superfamily)